jgi:hypothetical protein
VHCCTPVFKTGAIGHSATSPKVAWSTRADCREFSDYVNHSFLIVITPVWFVIRIPESELFCRIGGDDDGQESSIHLSLSG